MSIMNTDKILYGTDQKNFDRVYDAMFANYNENTATDFFNSYKDKSLLFILKNAEKIMKEPMYGTDFIMNIIRDGYVPFHMISGLEVKAKTILSESEGKVPRQQHDSYNAIVCLLGDIKKDYKNTIEHFKVACIENGKEYIESFYDFLYEIKTNGSDDEFNSFVSSVYYSSNAFVNVAVSTALLAICGEMNGAISFMIKDVILPECAFNEDIKNMEKYKRDAIVAIKKVSQDAKIIDLLNHGNHNVKYLWLGIVNSNDLKPVLKTESGDTFPIFSSNDLMERLVEESGEDSVYVENRKILAFDHLKSLRSYYESKRDCLIREAVATGTEYDENVVEKYNNCIDELSGKLAMMEWTVNGEPDETIKKHIMTQKQIDAANQAKEEEKKKARLDALNKMDEEENDKEEEDDKLEDIEEETSISSANTSFRKKVLDQAYKACRSVDGCKEHVTKDEVEKFQEGKTNTICLGSFKKENLSDVLKSVREVFKDSKDVNVTEDNYNTIFLNIKNKSQYFTETTIVVPMGDPSINVAVRNYEKTHKNDNTFIELSKFKKKTYKIKNGEKNKEIKLPRGSFIQEYSYNNSHVFTIKYKYPYIGNFVSIDFEDMSFKKHEMYYLVKSLYKSNFLIPDFLKKWVNDNFHESNDMIKEATETDDEGNMKQLGEDKTKTKPEKPKEDLATRIQNKAIDSSAKRAEKKSIRSEKMTKIKNAGKAVSAGPAESAKGVKGFFNKLGQLDIKRRKEFFLKPGYRHKIFRNMRLALMYGYGGIKYMPVLLLFRHFSKDKDRRLRNELVRELDSEIRICEEKINDANSNGDQKEKYKLMRIKDKLAAEKNRVELNSKYI